MEYSLDLVFGALDTFNQSTKNDYQVFKEELFNCFDFTLSTNLIDERFVQIHPNPINNQLWLESEDFEIIDINIFKINGQLVKSTSHHNSKRINLNFENQESGIYLLEIVTSKGIVRKKILKIE